MFYQSLSLLWILTMIANLANWAFAITNNRLLTLSQFATISLFSNLQIIISVVTLAIQIAMNKLTAKAIINPSSIAKASGTFGFSFRLGVSFTLLFILISPVWQKYFQTSLSTDQMLAISIIFVSLHLLSWSRGVLAGFKWYLLLGVTMLSESLIKLAIIITGVTHDPFSASIYSFPLALTITSVIAIISITKHPHLRFGFKLNTTPSKKFKLFVIKAILLTLGARILLSTDIILVKHYLTPPEAGKYATLALVGKIIFFFTSSLIGILVPVMAAKEARRQSSARFIALLTFIAVLFGSTITIIFKYLPQFTTIPMFGNKAFLITSYIIPIGFTSTAFSIVLILTTYLAFRSKIKYSILIILAILTQALLIHYFHSSLKQVIYNVFYVSVGLLLSFISFLLLNQQNTLKSIFHYHKTSRT